VRTPRARTPERPHGRGDRPSHCMNSCIPEIARNEPLERVSPALRPRELIRDFGAGCTSSCVVLTDPHGSGGVQVFSLEGLRNRERGRRRVPRHLDGSNHPSRPSVMQIERNLGSDVIKCQFDHVYPVQRQTANARLRNLSSPALAGALLVPLERFRPFTATSCLFPNRPGGRPRSTSRALCGASRRCPGRLDRLLHLRVVRS